MDEYDEITTPLETANDMLTVHDALDQQELPSDLSLDTSWDDYYTHDSANTHDSYSDDNLPVYQGETVETLQNYLLWQANLTPFTDVDRTIACAIIDAIDQRGFLAATLDEILQCTGIPDLSQEQVKTVLKRVQRFDPVGVAAVDDLPSVTLRRVEVDHRARDIARAAVELGVDLDRVGVGMRRGQQDLRGTWAGHEKDRVL